MNITTEMLSTEVECFSQTHIVGLFHAILPPLYCLLLGKYLLMKPSNLVARYVTRCMYRQVWLLQLQAWLASHQAWWRVREQGRSHLKYKTC